MPGPTMFVPQRRVRRGAALTLVFAGVLATGAATGSWGADGRYARDPADVRTAGKPLDRRAAEATEQAARDGKDGTAAAADAVSRGGDRWSAVYSAREYQGFERALDGAYIGVGLSVRRVGDGRIEVDDVHPASPAERAGITAGDRLVAVDRVPVTGHPVTEVVSRLRGDFAGEQAAPGTPVRLQLRHGDRRSALTLHRERLLTESVIADRYRDGGTTATRIRVGSFIRGTGVRVQDVIRGTAPGEGVLLDLRGNSGGLVTEAVTTASAFLDGGLVATYDVHGRRRSLQARPGGDIRRPLVVLVDGGTMSAGELLAGALQDRGRAVLVGSRTFGKGSVQMPSRLTGGSVAELTVGHYRTPAGHAVDGLGITPDLIVEGDAEPRARTVLGGLRTGA